MFGIQGQPHAVNVLQTGLASERMHHALIFHGPAGVGKCTAALALAKVLLCHDRQTDLAGQIDACGSCKSCQMAQQGTHPDLHLITKELARFHDDAQIRDRKLMSIPLALLRDVLIEPVYRSAQMHHGKVFIVDEAELLREDAQNVLLKTLEEPPAQTYLILVTSSEDRLLPTIRSRCQRVAFVPLPQEVLDAHLEKMMQSGELSVSTQQREWLMLFAAGSLGRMELALQYDLVAWADVVIPAMQQMPAGKSPAGLGNKIAKFVDDFAVRWVSEHKNASKEAANKQACALMLALIGCYASHELERAANQATGEDAHMACEPWLRVIDATTRTEQLVASNVNLSLACDHLAGLLDQSLSRASQLV